MTSNLWIYNLMSHFEGFLGVFSKDDVKNPQTFPAYVLVNFSNSNEMGSHYISIIFYDPNYCLYFDPLNLSFIPQEIHQYLRNNSCTQYRINYKIQNDSTIFCGLFCL